MFYHVSPRIVFFKTHQFNRNGEGKEKAGNRDAKEGCGESGEKNRKTDAIADKGDQRGQPGTKVSSCCGEAGGLGVERTTIMSMDKEQ